MSEIPTIAEAARLIAAKKLSPIELTRACYDRVHALDRELHAFILPTEDRAMADARTAEAAIMSGKSPGPLCGIPIGLKDIVDTKGIATTCHSKLLIDNVPDADATCAEKLAQAGTVMMGKTATHEFADGGPSFDLPWPPARNPWNTDHFTAGSSSGTGAGVAAVCSSVVSALTPAVRSAAPQHCAVSPASSPPMALSAARVSPLPPLHWTT